MRRLTTLIIVAASLSCGTLSAQEKYPLKQLTSDPAQEGFPSWSLDGKTVTPWSKGSTARGGTVYGRFPRKGEKPGSSPTSLPSIPAGPPMAAISSLMPIAGRASNWYRLMGESRFELCLNPSPFRAAVTLVGLQMGLGSHSGQETICTSETFRWIGLRKSYTKKALCP